MMFKEVDDSIREFIEDRMREYDPIVYNDDEFYNFFENEHKNIVFYDKSGEIAAFACILKYLDGYKMCYTYSNENGKRAYAKGIDWIIENYSPVYFGSGAMKFNKIKRLLHDTTTD